MHLQSCLNHSATGETDRNKRSRFVQMQTDGEPSARLEDDSQVVVRGSETPHDEQVELARETIGFVGCDKIGT